MMDDVKSALVHNDDDDDDDELFYVTSDDCDSSDDEEQSHIKPTPTPLPKSKEEHFLTVIANLQHQLKQKSINENLLQQKITELEKENGFLKSVINPVEEHEDQGCGIIALCSKRKRKRTAKKNIKQTLISLRVESKNKLEEKQKHIEQFTAKLEVEKLANADLKSQLNAIAKEREILQKKLCNNLIKSGNDRRKRKSIMTTLEEDKRELNIKLIAATQDAKSKNERLEYHEALRKMEALISDRKIEYLEKEQMVNEEYIRKLHQKLGYEDRSTKAEAAELISDWIEGDPPDLKFC